MILPVLLGADVLFPSPNQVEIRMDGVLLMRATVQGATAIAKQTKIEYVDEPAKPAFLGYPHGPKDAQFVPEGAKKRTLVIQIASTSPVQTDVSASSDSFPCSDVVGGPLMSSFNNGTSLATNGVYDRTGDWLLTCDAATGAQPVGTGKYRLSAKNGPVTIRLRTDYYRNHLGYFLWDKTQPLWRQPVAGWCSWMAHLQVVIERDVRGAAEFFAANLKGYGYNVIQIDDGYQRVLQNLKTTIDEPFSNYWTKPNDKFPSGLRTLAADITKLGMTPGIWVGYYLPPGLKNEKAYVTDRNGKPWKGPWVGYAMNPLVPEALEEGYLASIRQLRRDGWRYFKIDTLRHVLYDSFRMNPEYWKARGESMETAFRTLLGETKKVVGRDTYLLACWGTMPELAGIPDGARIGEDVGPDVASMRRSAKYIAQFHALNNVVWRNDPDYMCLRVPVPQAQTWATLTAMAGGHVMVSDPIKDYDPSRVDILRRVGPPIFLRPGNVAPQPADPEFMTLAARKFGEAWTVVSRFGWTATPASDVKLDQLGLDGSAKYLAYDFWGDKFLGVVSGSAPFHALEEGSCQVVSFRPYLDRPQFLGSDRHLGQGAYEIEQIRWARGVLSGKFRSTPGRSWTLLFHVPDAWHITGSVGGTLVDEGRVVRLRLPEADGVVDWGISFSRR